MSEPLHLSASLWILARPRLLPYVLLLVLAGYGWAHWDRALTVRGAGALPFVLSGWALLHAGTLWLNAAVDRDEGEVLMGRAIPVPAGIDRWGYLALVVAVGSCWVGDATAGVACAVAAVLAVLYSHPATLWKGHALGGPFVNVVGYGFLTPLAGWGVVDVVVNPRTVALWCLGALGILGAYFLAQAFQEEEDRQRGYRTLVATHGPRGVLGAARACVGLALGGAMVLAAFGWIPRLCLLGAPLGLWVDQWLRAWSEQPGGGSERWAVEAARRLLITGLVGLALTFVEYVRESFENEPVAGLGTAAGHPTDRPRLPPNLLRVWEDAQERLAVE